MKTHISIIGGGLAGCETALQLAEQQIEVNLFEQKPFNYSPAHKDSGLAELVCSNSLKSKKITTGHGLLKEELKRSGCFLLKYAEKCSVPAGDALAVDRIEYSKLITGIIEKNKYINLIRKEVTELPDSEITVIATGPLTSDKFSIVLLELIKGKYPFKMANTDEITSFKSNCFSSNAGNMNSASDSSVLFFYDAISPVITKESVNFNKVFIGSRYTKENTGQDYINCPFSRNEYDIFYNELVNAGIHNPRDFEQNNLFQGCMPVEDIAKRGYDTLRFGPLKPVGFDIPISDDFIALAQLRREDKHGKLYNLVGFQTRLKYGEQERVFKLIPGLENAEFVRKGSMHRNTYINSPMLLNTDLSLIKNPDIYITGQLTGVEGYVESIASGLLCAFNIIKRFKKNKRPDFSNYTMLQSLANYITDRDIKKFQPMNANFGLLPPLEKRIKDRKEKKEAYAKRSLDTLC